jgi:hypothetical protein
MFAKGFRNKFENKNIKGFIKKRIYFPSLSSRLGPFLPIPFSLEAQPRQTLAQSIFSRCSSSSILGSSSMAAPGRTHTPRSLSPSSVGYKCLYTAADKL